MSKPVIHIGAIYPNVPEIYPCADGMYSTSPGRNACTRHGGRASDTPLRSGGSGSGLLNVQDVPLQNITIDRELFQGREKAYSERSVQNIVSDVESGRFVWENLDPITLWLGPDGRLFLLSGHSRLEAFHRLAKKRAVVDGKGFYKIPAKIRTGSIAEAQRIALESNTLSTKESDTERATYYRRLREQGTEEKVLRELIKKNEDRNSENIYAYTFLSPNGYTWAALKQVATTTDSTATLVKAWARWIGKARIQNPFLSDEHETELFNWLSRNKGYGTGSNQVSNERDFLDKVKYFIQKNSFMGQFDTAKPLNIMGLLQKSPVEQQYDAQVEQAQKAILEQERKNKSILSDLTKRGATRADIARVLEPEERLLRNLRSELLRLVNKRAEIVEYSKKENTLFGVGIGKIYDDIQIKPGSRVDRYWGSIAIKAKSIGVRDFKEDYYLRANAAIKHFNLYSLEFGNWLNQEERAHFMYGSLVTLRDMAEVLGIPHKKMGIHRKLSLAFGSRGNGGRAVAFYQPSLIVINLTKKKGRGSLIHEYGHAIDYTTGIHSGGDSVRHRPDYTGKRAGTIAYNMEKAIELVLWNGDKPSSYLNWLDHQTKYYNQRNEIWARICETYFIMKFQEKGIFNTWGVPGRYRSDLPSPALVKAAAPYIKKIFHAAT